MRGWRLELARLQGEGVGDALGHSEPQLDEGVGVGGGNQALKPLAHLPPPWAAWGVVHSSTARGWRLQTPAPSLWELPGPRPPAPAPSSESAFLTVCATWTPALGVWSQAGKGCGGGWPPTLRVGLGVNCIETSPPKLGRGGAERPSPRE